MSEPALEPMPARGGRGCRRLVAAAAILVVLGLVVAGTGVVWAMRQVNPGSPGGPVAVDIPRGASTQRIASILEQRDVIANAQLFRYYVQLKGEGNFQAGRYTFRRNQSFDAVVRTFARGAELEFQRLTIPEGLILTQIAQRVGQLKGRSGERFLELARSGTVRSRFQKAGSTELEGFLLPETYEFEPKEDEEDILRRMVRAFDDLGTQLGLEQAPSKVGLAPHEVVIVASMIEREARVPDERPKVSRVIYNRIERGETLGIDATLRYGLDRPTAPLRQSDLASDNPYNTRKFKGLPPTAIASPGRSSLEAALNPEPGPWLFYVIADASGRHAFATTSAEFARYKAEAQAKGLL